MGYGGVVRRPDRTQEQGQRVVKGLTKDLTTDSLGGY